MTKLEHNGWYNYETWLVSLWMDNEKGSQDYWREQARFLLSDEGYAAHKSRFAATFTRDEIASIELANQIEEHHEDALPKLDGFACDLLNGAMSEVNWMEIAKHLIDELKAESTP